MINKLIEKYNKKLKYITNLKNKTSFELVRVSCSEKESIVKEVIKDLEELKIEIDKLAKDKNFFENYYYDDMFAKGKISKELYAKFKGLGVDTDE